MEKLDLYSEPESPPPAAAATAEPSIIFKTRVARLPRLLRAADLVAEEPDEGATLLKRGMPRPPRLVVTAVDTPRKYFKSRGGSSSTTAAAAADVANAAASAGTASSTPGPRSLRKAAAGSGNSSRAVTTAASVEEAAISIYTDENSAAVGDAAMTPQADRSSGRALGKGTAARSSRSTRKKNPEAATNPGTRNFTFLGYSNNFFG
jgi:hypothetical protein